MQTQFFYKLKLQRSYITSNKISPVLNETLAIFCNSQLPELNYTFLELNFLVRQVASAVFKGPTCREPILIGVSRLEKRSNQRNRLVCRAPYIYKFIAYKFCLPADFPPAQGRIFYPLSDRRHCPPIYWQFSLINSRFFQRALASSRPEPA